MQMHQKKRFVGKDVGEKLKKCWFHIFLLVSFSASILTLMSLDYLNIENENLYYYKKFNDEFRFLSTMKGRMFYLFFLWLLFIESVIDWDEIVDKKPRNRFRILAFFVCAVIPLIYVLGVNFWGLDQAVLSLGQKLGFEGDMPLKFGWALSFEYLVFGFSFLAAVLLAYKKEGLGFFSMGLSLLVGMGIVYTIDTFRPYGTFKPFEMLALPTAACAAAILDILGYRFSLSFDTRYVHPVYGSMPVINGVGIGWPCAGVHSLFLFTVMILLFFKRSSISTFRKFIYFVVGAFGTYFVNVLRIVSIFVIIWNGGVNVLFWYLDADFFHNSVGELYFIFWIFIYILIIVSIEKFMLVEKARLSVQKLRSLLGIVKSKFLFYLKTRFKRV